MRGAREKSSREMNYTGYTSTTQVGWFIDPLGMYLQASSLGRFFISTLVDGHFH